MNILTPEPRVDKNNRVVTRYVKSEASPSSARSTIPAPAPVKNTGMKLKDRRDIVKEALSSLDQQAVPSMKSWGNAKKNLMTLPDDELVEVTDVVRKYADTLNFASREFLGKMLNKGALMVETARTFDTLCSGMPEPDDEANVKAAIWGLGNSELLGGEDMTIPEGREEEARAHVRVVTALADAVGMQSGVYKMNPFGHTYLPDGPMKTYLAESPERADEIAAVIREREITSPQEIMFILDGGLPALSDGAL